jgi:peptidoglycan/LPS O-acetylase OafA/YrhL
VLHTLLRPQIDGELILQPVSGRIVAIVHGEKPLSGRPHTMQYRKEIDGLRALAVVPVILFHAGFKFFSGGFVGVDIFFVISGYLITNIISADISNGNFSIRKFYERRFRRIAPAFTVVLFFCMVSSWYFLLPVELVSFYKSVIYASVFSANIFFRGEAGYFDISSELKPLLHVWSLSVEEQFYLFFPILFFALSRFGRRAIICVLIGVFMVSIYYAEARNSSRPEAAFFLLKFRAWELALGALASILFASRDRSSWRRSTREFLCWIGFVSIVFSIFYFDKATPFPGLWALFPTLGASLIVIFADDTTLFGRMIGARYFVTIGLSSYGAYLWHNPLFVFTRYYYNDANVYAMVVMSVASIVLGFLSSVFVEKPCRDSRRVFFSVLAPSICIPIVIFVGFSAFGITRSGFYNRYSPQEVALLQSAGISYKETLKSYDLGHCFIDYEQGVEVLVNSKCVSKSTKRRVIVFGDSEGAHWMAGVWKTFGSEAYSVQQWTATSCRSIDYKSNTKRCREVYDYFVKNIVPQIRKSDIVIVACRWIGVLDTEGVLPFTESVRSTFEILSATGAKIIVIGNTPEFSLPPQTLVVRGHINNEGDVYLKTGDMPLVNQILKEESSNFGFKFANPIDSLCKRNVNLYCLVESNGSFYFFDGGHLSPAGSEFLFGKLFGSGIFG